MDPYVKITVADKVFRTKTHTDAGKSPSWSDEFSFKRTYEDTMCIYIYDEDVAKQDDLICEGKFSLATICNPVMNKFADNIPMFYKGKNAGELYINLTFHPDYCGPGYPAPAQMPYGMPQSAPYAPPMQPQCNRENYLYLDGFPSGQTYPQYQPSSTGYPQQYPSSSPGYPPSGPQYPPSAPGYPPSDPQYQLQQKYHPQYPPQYQQYPPQYPPTH